MEEELTDNHITGQKVCYRIDSGKQMYFNIEPSFSTRLVREITLSAWIKYEDVVPGGNAWNKFNVFKHNFTYHNSETGETSGVDYSTLASYTGTADWQYVHFTHNYTNSNYDELKGSLVFNLEGTKSGTAWVTGIKVEYGDVATDWSPAPEDLWSTATLVPTQQQRYLWKFEYIYYSDGSVETTQPVNLSIAGADADTTGVTAAISEIDSKADSLRADLTNVSNSLSNAASQLQAQAAAQADLTSRVSTVEETANGTKTTVTELAKTVDDNTDDITSITQRTSAIETDLSGTKATLSQVQTAANTTTANLASYQASNDQAVASLQSSLQTTDGNVSNLQTKVEAVPGQITSAVSAVEGKIPTDINTRNLWIQSKAAGSFVEEELTDNHITGQKVCYRIDSGKQMYFNIEPSFSTRLVREITLSAWIKYEDVVPGGNAWNKFNVFKHNFTYHNSETGETSGVDYSTLASYTGTADWQYVHFTHNYTNSNYDELKGSLVFNLEGTKSGTAWITGIKVEYGNTATPYSAAPEDTASQISSLSSQIQQTADGMTLLATKTELNTAKTDLQTGISTATSKADNAQTTANSAVLKANAAQTAVNTLDSEVVKSASLNLDNNGFVTKVGKTIDGNKFATMIAQNANNVKIIADEMQVTADMIVDGAVTANKLNVNNLSAVNSNLGAIKGGSLLLQENKTASSSVDNWGTFNRPAHRQGLYMDNHGLASSGPIQRKNGSETTPTDMPLAVLQSGELRFLVVDYNDNLENVLHYGLSDPDYGVIRFEIDSELKRRLTMTSSGYLNFQATNYTNWTSTGVSGCEYMIQGRLVLVNYDVTFNSAGTHTIGGIPQEFTKKSLMMTAKAWTITPRDKNIQLNSDGSLHILDAEANVNYRGTLVFSY
ncbi:hypothetical protein GPZ88_00670 [Streptococcus ruminicola]|uniref:Uncharacterized protein n=1 Tax=Streptococcus ruminicola TaxID=2686210 RepID=A0A6G8HXL5_9STRE|nr:hypothetical protein [Streptococcus ruminicola]QIM45654.1 hypothetical protein GPZ88_00670 [Streptococcus ruminicola]